MSTHDVRAVPAGNAMPLVTASPVNPIIARSNTMPSNIACGPPGAPTMLALQLGYVELGVDR